MMTHVAKIIEIIGSSEKGWSEAAQGSTGRGKEDHQRNHWTRSRGYYCKGRPKHWQHYSIPGIGQDSIQG